MRRGHAFPMSWTKLMLMALRTHVGFRQTQGCIYGNNLQVEPWLTTASFRSPQLLGSQI